MLDATKSRVASTKSHVTDFVVMATPPRQVAKQMLIVMAILALVTGTAAAQGSSGEDIKSTLHSIGGFMQWVIVGVAVPNGAYGLLQYMTAGSSVEKDEAGRKRLRNTFIGIAGIAVIEIMVNVLASTLSVAQ